MRAGGRRAPCGWEARPGVGTRPGTAWALLALLLASGPASAESPFPALLFPEDAPLASTEEGTGDSREERHPGWALLEVTSINVLIWTADRYVLGKDWARIDLHTWERNLRTGFVWDGDGFSTNQFSHPYHGGLYYTAARDHGFSYWESAPFTFVGSLQWELFAENEPPSLNDLVNTTLGGMAMGEMLYRAASLVLDTETTGRERVGREVAAGLLSPVRGFNRLVRGDVSRREPTPEEWRPASFATWGSMGYLKLSDRETFPHGEDQFFADLELRYGDAYRGPARRPFDAFDMRVQFTTKEGRLVSHARLLGLLAAETLHWTERAELRLALFQQYNLIDTVAYEVGGQAFSVSLLSQYQLSEKGNLKTALHLNGSVLTGISSEHSGRPGRDYDYGPGLGLQAQVVYARGPWDVLTLEAGSSYILALSAEGTRHAVHSGQLQVDMPVWGSLGLGAEFNLFLRQSQFTEFRNRTRRTQQVRFFVSFHPGPP